MVDWMRRKPILTAILVVAFCLVVQGYRILSLALDLRAVLVIVHGTGVGPALPPTTSVASWPASPRYAIDLAVGLEPPAGVGKSSDLGQLVGKSYNPGDPFFAPDAEIREYLEQVPGLDATARRLTERLAGGLASWPVPAPDPAHVHFLAPMPDWRGGRAAGRFWCLLAWHLARHGDPGEALLAACGPAILAGHQEARETQVAGLTLISKMIGTALRRMSGQALQAIAPVIRPTKAQAVDLLRWVETCEAHSLSLARALHNEMNFLPSVGYYGELEIQSGDAMKIYGRNPSALMRVLRNKALVDSYLDPILGECIRACDEPYPVAVGRIKGAMARIEDLQATLFRPGLHWLGFLLRPERACLEMILCLATPNITGAYGQVVLAQAQVRGGAAAVAIQAFRQEWGCWPSSLADLEGWMDGVALPTDPFTGGSFGFVAGNRPALTSPGPDLATGTADDLDFLAPTGN
ncbi:MAG: hypothetical protein GX442_18395 [Candidatus Riflebacteria bacterium]|nr:hypothetical protein [Candidatus Riflebacteria bacterium]